MKDNLFEMLLNLFEKTITQLKERHGATSENGVSVENKSELPAFTNPSAQSALIKSAQEDSIRVFTELEQQRLTKASYQFLMRMSSAGVLAPDVFELILNQLMFSSSRFVGLQETKWTIRNTLSNHLDAMQLSFLDLVLYHKEDQLPLH